MWIRGDFANLNVSGLHNIFNFSQLPLWLDEATWKKNLNDDLQQTDFNDLPKSKTFALVKG